jgi:hypothetical protein
MSQRRTTVPPTRNHSRSPASGQKGLIVKGKTKKQSAGRRPVLDDRFHRTYLTLSCAASSACRSRGGSSLQGRSAAGPRQLLLELDGATRTDFPDHDSIEEKVSKKIPELFKVRPRIAEPAKTARRRVHAVKKDFGTKSVACRRSEEPDYFGCRPVKRRNVVRWRRFACRVLNCSLYNSVHYEPLPAIWK